VNYTPRATTPLGLDLRAALHPLHARSRSRALCASPSSSTCCSRATSRSTPTSHELAERYAAASARVRLHLIDPDRQRERLIGLAQTSSTCSSSTAPPTASARSPPRASSCAGATATGRCEREQLRELGPQTRGDEDAGRSRVLNAKITVERSHLRGAAPGRPRARHEALLLRGPRRDAPRVAARARRLARGRAAPPQLRRARGRGARASGVPSDCDALIVAGRSAAWPSEDDAALIRYLRAGGNVAVFLDLGGARGPGGAHGPRETSRGSRASQLPAAVTVEADSPTTCSPRRCPGALSRRHLERPRDHRRPPRLVDHRRAWPPGARRGV
jgi:hypothetical protein